MGTWAGGVMHADDAMLRWLNSGFGRWPVLDHAMSALIKAPTLKFGLFMVLLVWLWFSPGSQRLRARQVAIATVLSGLIGLTLARVLALLLPFRDRPFARVELGLVMPPGYAPDLRTWSAFPSDHAVVAFALATGLWLVSRRMGWVAFVHAALIVCLPRIYMGLHHPTDVLAGALIGVAVTALMCRPAWCQALTRPVLATEVRHPQVFYAGAFLVMIEMITMFDDLRTIAVTAFRMLHHAG